MKCLLVAVNAKYIHSNPGILCLKAYYEKFCRRADRVEVETAEYTINQQTEKIVADIYQRQPDVLCFSCYIWNIRWVEEIADTLKKVLPEVCIWAGGPEVSYRAEKFLEAHEAFQGVMCGEGESVFAQVMEAAQGRRAPEEIPGICFRDGEDRIVCKPPGEPVNFSEVPFIYSDMKAFENRIVYYESSRGCPFSCSYCLSSIDKRLRFREMEKVKKEIAFFLECRVPQVKFIDRTFNCNHSRTEAIWRYILENDNGVTNFHFEVAADLITEEEFALLSRMRKGLVQLEIGIQSTNPDTLREIERVSNLDKLMAAVAKIKGFGNIHQHVDLIAGLPYEDMQSFQNSFNRVYALKCEQVQLGFLKVLSGSKMYENAGQYGIAFTSEPPYEVLCTDWLSYGDILELKQVEEMVEVYYNSGQFEKSIEFLEKYFDTPYELYRALGKFYGERFQNGEKHTRLKRYELLLEFAKEKGTGGTQELAEWLTYDVYLRENSKKRPDFSVNLEPYKERLKKLYRIYKTDGKNMHIEVFLHIYGEGEEYVLFDYRGERCAPVRLELSKEGEKEVEK